MLKSKSTSVCTQSSIAVKRYSQQSRSELRLFGLCAECKILGKTNSNVLAGVSIINSRIQNRRFVSFIAELMLHGEQSFCGKINEQGNYATISSIVKFGYKSVL